MTFMGLHAEIDSPLYVPTFCSELKRRLFAHVFIIDKANVAISGRPPLLSRRFCTTPMPLDIPDEYFFADAATFNAALSDISETGWSRVESLNASTILRGRLIIAQLEEEIQELALGGEKSANVEEVLYVLLFSFASTLTVQIINDAQENLSSESHDALESCLIRSSTDRKR
jgi:hypothetical protein